MEVIFELCEIFNLGAIIFTLGDFLIMIIFVAYIDWVN